MFAVVFAASFCLVLGAKAQSYNRYVKPLWLQDATGEMPETWGWQKDPKSMEALAYLASTLAFDSDEFGCAQPLVRGWPSPTQYSVSDKPSECSKATLARCPSNRAKSSAGAGTAIDKVGLEKFLKTLGPWGYCSTNGQDRLELMGQFSPELEALPFYKDNFIAKASGSSAHLQDSYALIPRALRRQALSTLRQMIDFSRGGTCDDYRKNKNVLWRHIIERPAYYYDCAYRVPKDVAPPSNPLITAFTNSNQDVTFVPRVQDAWPPAHDLDSKECVKPLAKLYFESTNCSGPALLYFDMAKKDLNFFRVRDKSVPAQSVVELSATTAPKYGDVQSAKKMVWTAYFTEILDKTIYYTSVGGDAYRRTVRFIEQPTTDIDVTHHDAVDAPYIQAYVRMGETANAQYNSIHSVLVPGTACRLTVSGTLPTDPSLKYAPPSGAGSGYYGYLDRVPGNARHYSGVILRQYRDIFADPVVDLANDPTKIRAMITNQYFMNVLDFIKPANAAAPSSIELESMYPVSMTGPSASPPPAPATAPPAIRTVKINEWWVPDEFGDKTGLAQGLMCGEGEELYSLGRNDADFGSYTKDFFRKTAPTPSQFCARYLFSRQPRRDAATGVDILGDAGNPLPDMSFLSNGVRGGAMICENDPLIQSVTAVDFSGGANNFYDPGPSDGVIVAPPAVSYLNRLNANHILISVLGSMPAPKVLDSATFFDRNAPSGSKIGGIANRAIGLGDPVRGNPYPDSGAMAAGIQPSIPTNYGFCVATRLSPELPNSSMGPLAIPMRNYMIDLVVNNTSGLGPNVPPYNTPPHCSLP